MRLNSGARRRGAVVFLPLVLALGCGAPQQASSEPPGKALGLKDEQIVCVMLPDNKPGTKPMPSVDPVKLSQGKGHVAHWILCGDGQLTITMKVDPFDVPVENAGKHSRSGKPKASAIGKKFGYTIVVTTKDGTFTNDPDVEVIP